MQINRDKLEKLTTSLAVTLLSSMVVLLTLVAANGIFRWDLFPPDVERVGGLFLVVSFLVILSSVIINIMVNIGRIADHFEHKN